MRLHRVQVQGFGPFAEAVTLDVDRAAAHGLFLLHGPTGSGKTSLLDAICYALYGSVPGSRAKADRLTSDFPGAAEPRVVLEFSARGRRIEVTRSPAWNRPKSRGTGTTPQPSRVLLRELVDGQWVPLTGRIDEAGHLLSDLIGMGKDQFTQVTLLPQYGFAEFLRAPSDERTALLEKLFGTVRFAQIEGWLAGERSSCGRDLERRQARRDGLLDDLERTARTARLPGFPTHESDHPRAHPDRGDELAVRIGHELVTTATTQAASAVAHRQQADAALTTARRTVDRARDAHDRAAATLTTARRWRGLLAAGDEIEELRRRLDTAQRAEMLRPGLDLHDHAGRDLTRATARAEEAAARLTDLVGVVFGDDPPEAQDLTARRGRLTAELEAAARLERTGARVLAARTRTESELTACQAGLSTDSTDNDADRARLAAIRAELPPVRAQADDTVAAQELDRACAVLAAARRAEALAARAQTAEHEEIRCRTVWLAAQERYLSLLDTHLLGVAAGLAEGLRPGAPCPVCGSAEHPHPARTTDQVPRADVDAARALAEERRSRLDEAVQARAGLATELAGELARCEGTAPEEAEARVTRWQAAVAVAEHARERFDDLTRQADLLEARITSRDERIIGHRERLAALTVRWENVRAEADQLTQVIDEARAHHPDVASRLAAVQLLGTAETALQACHQTRLARAETLVALQDELGTTCAAAGFAALTDARDALVEAVRRTAWQHQIREHEDAVTAAAATLAGLSTDQTGPDERPAARTALAAADAFVVRCRECAEATAGELAVASAAVEAAEAAQADAVSRLGQLTDARDRIQEAAGELNTLVAGTAPLRDRMAHLTELAGVVTGTGTSNQARMRLSSYVLLARLSQVTDAANERLTVMSDGRYLLVPTTDRTKGSRRAGLGLRVLDAWTSVERDPVSLSGGESFLASLALALGLADVVLAEAGGLSIETLFIDEGFGSLDEDTLELVMTCLDRLREGGRTVGVVSHVNELRARIPHQVRVSKGADGSRVQLRELAG